MFSIESCALDGLCITLATQPSPHILDDIVWYVAEIKKQLSDVVVDVVPAYVTVTVYFRAVAISRFDMANRLKSIYDNKPLQLATKSFASHLLPVWYDPEVCPDLAACAQFLGLHVEDVIHLHCKSTYRVYALGFMPGFAYLGDVPDALHMPRHAEPRQQVPKGAVAIAAGQTAIYPSQTPGGWQVLGLCPIPLIDLNKQGEGLLQVGDSVVFEAIDEQRFIALGGEKFLGMA